METELFLRLLIYQQLNLVQFFDRGIMNANEIRSVFNLADIPSGDEYYVRLDTAKINGEGGEEE